MTSNPSSDDPAIVQDSTESQELETPQPEAQETMEASVQPPEVAPPPVPVPEAQAPFLDDVALDEEPLEYEEEEPEVQDMGQLLDSMEPIKPLRRGEVVDGEVMGFSDDGGILVNIGHKSEGVVQQREMRSLSQEELQNLGIGDQIITYVLRPESADNPAILSIDRALGETGWRELEKCLEDNETVEGSIPWIQQGRRYRRCSQGSGLRAYVAARERVEGHLQGQVRGRRGPGVGSAKNAAPG